LDGDVFDGDEVIVKNAFGNKSRPPVKGALGINKKIPPDEREITSDPTLISQDALGKASCRNWHREPERTSRFWLPGLHRAGPSTPLDKSARYLKAGKVPANSRAILTYKNPFVKPRFGEGVEKLRGWKLLRRLGIEKAGVFSCGGEAPARENTSKNAF